MLFALAVTGCAKKTTMDESGPPGATQDELTGLEQQLAQRESELQAIGVAPQGPVNDLSSRERVVGSTADTAGGAQSPASQPAPTPAPAEMQRKVVEQEDEGGRCEQVCEISAAICTLEQQICGLLPRHQGDARYQSACDRSVADCQLATEACHACNAN